MSSAQHIIISSYLPTYLPIIRHAVPLLLIVVVSGNTPIAAVTYRYRAAAAEVRVNVAAHASETEKPARARYTYSII